MAEITGTNGGTIDPHDLDLVAVASNPLGRARERIFDVDSAMRRNYDLLKAGISATLSPVIVVQPDLRGGSYTLIRDGTRISADPVAPIFQLAKSVCHLPLGIYSILAPYLKDPGTSCWGADLEAFREVAAAALKNLDRAALPPPAEAASRTILTSGIAYMEQCIDSADFTMEGFKAFAGSLHGPIVTNMDVAARALISGVENLLAGWRVEMGEADWKNLYTVILAIWTTETRNQHYEILRRVMDQETVEERLIVISVGEQEPAMIAVALDNLARIVQDNVAAGLIFPTDSELADVLAGTEDLLAGAVDQAMRSCPHPVARRPS